MLFIRIKAFLLNLVSQGLRTSCSTRIHTYGTTSQRVTENRLAKRKSFYPMSYTQYAFPTFNMKMSKNVMN